MNDDLISRQAAIDSVEIFLKQTDAPEVYPGLIPALARVINNVPSAQPERKKGCKIVKGTGTYGYCACDQCGKPVHPEDRFCSKCGADFREDT